MSQTLSPSQTEVLTAAARRAGRLVLPLPERLKGIAGSNVIKSLLTKNLIEEVDADPGDLVWRETGDGHSLALVATDEGLRAIGDGAADTAADEVAKEGHVEQGGMDNADEQDAPAAAPEAQETFEGEADEDGLEREWESEDIPGTGEDPETAEIDAQLEQDVTAAEAAFVSPPDTAAILASERVANDVHDILVRYLRDNGIDAEAAEHAAARAAGALPPPAKPKLKRRPTNVGAAITRPGGKLHAMIEMMSKPEGATVSEMAAALDWVENSVRGAMSGSKKKFGLDITSTKKPGDRRVYHITPKA